VQAVLGEEVSGNAHTACEAVVVGQKVVERFDITSMEGDGEHVAMGVEGVDVKFMGG
jgi:VCBS repeat-containing protein